MEEYKIHEGDDRIGHHRIYKFPNGFGASVRTSAPNLHAYSFYAEIAVLKFLNEWVKDEHGKDVELYDMTYDTPITDDVVVLDDEEEVIEILNNVKLLEVKKMEDIKKKKAEEE